jgi:hypothetical protein
MGAIGAWFEDTAPPAKVGSGIFVMRLGAPVEVTREEWEKLRPGFAPVTVKP